MLKWVRERLAGKTDEERLLEAEREHIHQWMMEHSPSYASSNEIVRAYLRDGLEMDIYGSPRPISGGDA